MLQAKRLDIIRKNIDNAGYVDVTSLANELGISKSTVRRDLRQLEKEEFVELTWGGAVSLVSNGSVKEDPYQIKKESNLTEKQRLAKYASAMLQDRQSVFLDAGTSVGEMVPFINKMAPDLLVATNDIMIAKNLGDTENIILNVVGGTVRKGYYTLLGVIAETILEELHLDIAFMSCDSLSLENGFSITNAEEVPVKRMIMSAAKRVVMLCDHSKFEKNSFMRLFNFMPSIEVVTGKELDDEIYNKYLEQNLNITRV